MDGKLSHGFLAFGTGRRSVGARSRRGSTDAPLQTAFPIGGREGYMTIPSTSTPTLASG